MDVLKRARKAINDEQLAIQENAHMLNEQYLEIVEAVQRRKGKIVFTGVGKSGHIGKKLAATFSSLGLPAIFVHSTEAVHGDLGMIEEGDVVFLLSNSGETTEVLNVIPALDNIGVTKIAFTSKENSTMAKKSDYILSYKYNKEIDGNNLAPTTSAIVMLSIGDSLGVVLSELIGFTKNDFHKYHPGGSLGKQLQEG